MKFTKVKDNAGNSVNLYRTQGSSLYKFDKQSDAYIHCYKHDGLKGGALIEEYERREFEGRDDHR